MTAPAAEKVAEAGQRKAERLSGYALGLLTIDGDQVTTGLSFMHASDRMIVAFEPLVLVSDLRAGIDFIERSRTSRGLLQRRSLGGGGFTFAARLPARCWVSDSLGYRQRGCRFP